MHDQMGIVVVISVDGSDAVTGVALSPVIERTEIVFTSKLPSWYRIDANVVCA